jgi:hypothetical protein
MRGGIRFFPERFYNGNPTLSPGIPGNITSAYALHRKITV